MKKHAIKRIIQRNLNKKVIIDFLTNKEIVGIHKQKRQVYKLWFEYNNIEDLTIIFKIQILEIEIITVIKENNKKRLKNDKK
ncbi:MAG: hypothetical protein ACOC16_01015 [Nanoarchaeota archaeon]